MDLSMQINRLFEIVYLLMERGSITAGELAERFEVTTRTIYRDIDTLSGAGIPVYANRGRSGGIRLLDHFTLDKSLLSAREQNEILFALESLKATNASENSELLSRLSGMFHKGSVDWIDVDFSEWDSGQEERDKFLLLKTAILDCFVLGFTYYNSNGEKSRRSVEPEKLSFKTGCWYLQAFCRTRQDFRTFKIKRMEELQLSEEHFQRREMPVPSLQSASYAGRYVRLQLWISPDAAYRVYDEFSPAQVSRRGDGSFTVSVEYPDGPWVYGYLLSFGENLKVISPPDVQAILLRKSQKIAAWYRDAKIPPTK